MPLDYCFFKPEQNASAVVLIAAANPCNLAVCDDEILYRSCAYTVARAVEYAEVIDCDVALGGYHSASAVYELDGIEYLSGIALGTANVYVADITEDIGCGYGVHANIALILGKIL